jgi:hypothetical protein
LTFARERLPLLLAWLVPFALFLATAYRDVGYWDTGEMDVVPYIAGIAHPTGFPAYIIVGWLVTHLVPFGEVAFRMTLLSVASLSLAAFVIARIVYERYENAWAGAAAAWIFAAGGDVWAHATKAEVHAVAALATVATLYCALRWFRTGETRTFYFGAVAWAIGIATHPVCALLLPGLLVLLIGRLHRLPSKTLIGAIAIAAAVVVAFYAYLPLRSAYVSSHGLDPQRALGLPAGRPFFDYDHPSTLDGLRAEVSGSDFDVNGGLRAILNPVVYAERGGLYLSAIRDEFTWFGLYVLLGGVAYAFARERLSTVALLLCGAIAVPFALGYSDETDIGRYFITSFMVASIFIGAAVAGAARFASWTRLLAPLGAVAIACALVYTQPNYFHQPYDDRPRHAIDMVKVITEPNAMIVASWAYGTPLAYAAYVEHDFGQRGLDVAWIDDDADFVRQLAKTRPVYYVGGTPGSVPGYRLEALTVTPPIYKLVKNR